MQTKKVEITVPESWDDITINQYKEAREVPTTSSQILDTCQRLAVFCKTDIDTFLSIKADQLKAILERMQWMNDTPVSMVEKWMDPDTKQVYVQVKPEELTGYEWVELENYVNDPDAHVERIVAIVCREQDEDGKPVEFSKEKLEERAALFGRKMPISVATGIVGRINLNDEEGLARG